jgi:hypothetical protein
MHHSSSQQLNTNPVVVYSMDTSANKRDHTQYGHHQPRMHIMHAYNPCAVSTVQVNWFTIRAQMEVNNNTNPANFYGWNGEDTTSRANKRKAYLAAPDYQKLCDDPGLYLDSFMMVGASIAALPLLLLVPCQARSLYLFLQLYNASLTLTRAVAAGEQGQVAPHLVAEGRVCELCEAFGAAKLRSTD